MAWPTNYNKFGDNRTPVLQGLSSTDNTTPIPVAVDPVTGEILTNATATISGNVAVSTEPSPVNVGQTTSGTSAVQLSSTSIVPVNGILVQAISTNTASVFIGGSGVTTSTGFELQAGQAVPFTCNNITDLYVVGSNTTDKVCWNVM